MNQNEPAFPSPSQYGFGSGLTKRELFAAIALQGMLSRSNINASYQKYAEGSIAVADALLAELEKGKEKV